ncbi:8-oxo-dGTP diphosphatase [Patescibacteria group bacterium]|nr:8-oxo-dGTP diphosphatase [Patescibacteria group bacterium]
MIQTTLCYLLKEGQDKKEILLAMKKRGFGIGKWNGAGGKMDLEKDKNILDATIRETEEEIGVKVGNLEKVAVLSFFFEDKKEWNQDVHVYFAKEWKGEPKESEEMKPKWFDLNDIPYDETWDDDKFWLPQVLAGEKLKANFFFGKGGDKIINHNIRIVKEV